MSHPRRVFAGVGVVASMLSVSRDAGAGFATEVACIGDREPRLIRSGIGAGPVIEVSDVKNPRGILFEGS